MVSWFFLLFLSFYMDGLGLFDEWSALAKELFGH
jgi:hypothetical protein